MEDSIKPSKKTRNAIQYPVIDASLVRGLEVSLSGSPFYQSYIDMRDQAIEKLKLPAIGTLISVTIENPHLNLTLEDVDGLVGCNVDLLDEETIDVYPNTSASQRLFNLSQNRWEREDGEDGNDLMIKLYGMVFDYTFSVQSRDDKITESPLMVHIITNPFTPLDGNYLKVGCTIPKDGEFYHDISELRLTDIVEAFRPAKTF